MKIFLCAALMALATSLGANNAASYLPQDADPDPTVPTPESVLGWDVGDWHVSHDKLVQYMQTLAAASPRVSIKVVGHTYEQRPLLQLAITSPENQENLESLRQQHLDGEGPLVVWLGYSVHGDEPSGANASLLVAYYLASSRSAFVEELLEGSVILIDPSVNPDGLNRYASWVNSNAGSAPVADPVSRQHVQNWPEARTNHYWFDLNRDWLPLVQPESRARIVEYHRWLPHVLTDHHEQDNYPGFFFQPGVPSRQHPLTPDENLELTRALAQFHSRAMDKAGQPYFTEDAYDDFYYGKGSTYPDINGSIGILFEQRAILGQELETGNGIETFRSAVANQLRMSLSTLEGSWAMRERLKTYQSGFHQSMRSRTADRHFTAWVIGDDGDPARAQAFLETLELHQIEYHALDETVRADGHEYLPGHAWIIPVQQNQFGLAEALLEQRTEFPDTTFYDVSAWTLPLAYNLPFTALNKVPRHTVVTGSSNGIPPDAGAAAWIIPWNQLEAPQLLQGLLTAGLRVRVATKPFATRTSGGLGNFEPGTLVIQSGVQSPEARNRGLQILTDEALGGLEMFSLSSTMTAVGPDFGSRHFALVEPINPLLVGGEGTSAYGVGEQWFLLDRRLGIPTTIVEQQRLGDIDLWDYSHVLLADGEYDALSLELKSSISRWVTDGGILLTIGQAASWAESLCFEALAENCPVQVAVETTRPAIAPRAYADFTADQAEQIIGGAIVASMLDLSHPLAFGYTRAELPLFRSGTTVLKPSDNPYSTPVRYSREPLMAGFIGKERLADFAGLPAVIAEKQGQGLVIRFGNTPLFRGFWRGTEKLFINALYFGQVIEPTELPEFDSAVTTEVPTRP